MAPGKEQVAKMLLSLTSGYLRRMHPSFLTLNLPDLFHGIKRITTQLSFNLAFCFAVFLLGKKGGHLALMIEPVTGGRHFALREKKINHG